LGYFILSKKHNEPPKVAQLAKKITQSGHLAGDILSVHKSRPTTIYKTYNKQTLFKVVFENASHIDVKQES
jgi:hypothetical protein